tara:strand:+ start:42 stop:2795 length:2754 start_codon:yes stop_codon:yes gene_type:complete
MKLPENYWSKKLHAITHDTPEKCVDIANHVFRAKDLQRAEQLDGNWSQVSDPTSSAADRIPFPHWKTGCRSGYDPEELAFINPLSGETYKADAFKSTSQAEEITQKARPVINEKDDRLNFLTKWRFWKNWASDLNENFAFLPAETRLPDHTIWNHLFVTSAIEGCNAFEDNPSFLLFQIGPVQDFIAASRSTRDLWSGSYLLSYLTATGLKYIAETLGPDHVIFPNLQNQPIMDLLMKDSVWDKVSTHEKNSIGDCLLNNSYDRAKALIPNLPNRFMAIIPSGLSEEIAQGVENAIRDKLDSIAKSIAEELSGLEEFDKNQSRFHQQVSAMLQVSWQTLSWPKTIEEVMEIAEQLPKEANGEAKYDTTIPFQKILEMVKNTPLSDRDKRYFTDDENKQTLNQVSNSWSILYALVEWLAASSKNTRVFNAWADQSSWEYGKSNNKDSLNGKEEAVLWVDSDEKLNQYLAKAEIGKNGFKSGEILGSSTLIKRLWHKTWLMKAYCNKKNKSIFKKSDFAMPDTHSIAKGNPFSNDDDKGDEQTREGYYAILALDGDQIGKWLSGSHNKIPKMGKLLSKEAREYFSKSPDLAKFLIAPRALTPSYHLQFSEMLGNFAIYCVKRIVEAHHGRLIYAGGDDVLAMLPATLALDCSKSIRAAFRGDNKKLCEIKGEYLQGGENYYAENSIFKETHNGFIRLNDSSSCHNRVSSEPVNFSAMVPGKEADVSAGISIGHAKEPLQDMVKEAQLAEKRAKIDRGSVAVSLFKRSGEQIQWLARWEDFKKKDPTSEIDETKSSAIGFFTLLKNLNIGSRFPYKVLERISPYQTAGEEKQWDAGFQINIQDILLKDLLDCIDKAEVKVEKCKRENIEIGFIAYWNALQDNEGTTLTSAKKLQNFSALMQLIAWLSRKEADIDTSHLAN